MDTVSPWKKLQYNAVSISLPNRSCRWKNKDFSDSDLQLVFEKAHVGDSVVDLRQQSFHILHCDAEKEMREGKYI